MLIIVALNHSVVNGPKIRADIQTLGGFLYCGGRSGCHAESRTVTSPSPAEGGLKPASITAETLNAAHLSPDRPTDGKQHKSPSRAQKLRGMVLENLKPCNVWLSV